MTDTIIESFINTIKENPNRTTLREIIGILDDPILASYKDQILNLTISEIFDINHITTEEECIAALIQNQSQLQLKTITEMATMLGCARDIVAKTVSFLKEDTTYPIKIEQVGEKRGARYKVISK